MTAPECPCGLSAEARGWWGKITTGYGINDAGGLLILQTALEALDRMRQAQTAIAEHGAAVLDRWGQLKANPACVIERDSRSQMLAALRQLRLDVEPGHDRPGRPSGK